MLAKGLDAGTAFEILSIDIADVNVGKNIGATLQTDQAEADKRVAQAKAEERRGDGGSRRAGEPRQSRGAAGESRRGGGGGCRAPSPKAFRSGNLGIMDYYNLENIQSDTKLRSNIAQSTEDADERS